MWQFKTLSMGDPERDPHEVEFFNLTGIADAVVREFIQNSLDAKCDGSSIIRITFENATKEKSKVFFNNIENHLRATSFYSFGFDNDVIPYLTIEDFGTTGLDGATGENGIRPAGRNNFYNFWWYEGKSEKTGKDRGRWGLGKTTFHVASHIRSFFGLTVRQDDKRKLLMGKALLKTHKINSDTFTYNGYFTDKEYKPYSDLNLLKQFSESFGLLREGEPGLSLVIPFPHSEITPSEVLKSTIIHYFYPILNQSLEIMLRYNGKEEELKSGNLIEIASQQDWSETIWEKVKVKELLEFIDRARTNSILLELKIDNPENPEINANSFIDQLELLREKFNNSEIISFRVPVKIEEVNQEKVDSYFDVFIQKKQENTAADEYYIRSGITISDIKMIPGFPVRALFIAEEGEIANFLGDAETPAHTYWKENTEGFAEKYIQAKRKLRFIKKGVLSILNYIYLPPKELKKDFLKEVFYVKSEPRNESDDEDETTSKIKEPIPVSKPRKYQLIKVNGGFKIMKSKNEFTPPLNLRIRCAYDTRKGNPFTNYELYDFNLSNSEFNFTSSGCSVLSKQENKIELTIQHNEFEFEVTGFDQLRDLIVDIKEIKL
jgi:hypothetical protein